MLVVLMSLSAALMAQRPDGGARKSFRAPSREMRPEVDRRGPANGLNLTAEQKEAFKQGMMATQKKLQPLRNELGELKARQRTLMTAESPDLNAIDKNIEKMGDLKAEMEKIQSRQRIEMRSKLTDEQRLKFDMHRGEMRQHGDSQRMRPGRGMQQGASNN